ncbi:similarity to aminoacyl-tRNA editing enzymes YbaK, ProX [Lachnospiraceae bacterium KM106-2]|nr:similarity to aminoacyl-tRNA editing enzymes YbaK, ProX [Lachnospiraceae bacterium KM106-2]
MQQSMVSDIYTTMPSSEGREAKEMAVYELLEQLGIPFARVDHPAMATVDSCSEVSEKLGITICKNLFLCNASKKQFYLLMMPGEKRFHTKEFSKQIGSSRLSFAPEEYMEEFLSITPGSVSVLGLMNDVRGKVALYIDREVIEKEYIGCHPCKNTSSLRIKTEDVINKFLPYVNHEMHIVDL